MADKIATLKKHMTPYAFQIAENLISKFGNMKMLLSAAMVALSKLDANEREKYLEEAKRESPDEGPADLHNAIQSIVKVMTGDTSNVTINILPEEENKIADFIIKTLGPKEEKLQHHKHKKA